MVIGIPLLVALQPGVDWYVATELLSYIESKQIIIVNKNKTYFISSGFFFRDFNWFRVREPVFFLVPFSEGYFVPLALRFSSRMFDRAFVVFVIPFTNEPFWPEKPVRPSVFVFTSC